MTHQTDSAAVTPLANPAVQQSDTRVGAGLLNSEEALEGLQELIEKLEPLLAGRRLNRLIDLASVTADLVDMTDAYTVEKVMKAGDEGIGAVWTLGNAARMAAAQVSTVKGPPSLLGLLRMTRQAEVRRGLAFSLALAGILGRQFSYDEIDPTIE